MSNSARARAYLAAAECLSRRLGKLPEAVGTTWQQEREKLAI